MATRFYFPSSGGAPVSPDFDAAWEDTTRASRRTTSTSKTGTLTVAKQFGQGAAGAVDVLAVQFISDPLASGLTISGTVKGQIVCAEYSTDLNARAQLVIRVVSGDGSTVRGTLAAAQTEALSSEWGLDNAPKNRKFPLAAISPVTVTNVDAQEGDRIVIEVGAKVDDGFADEMEMTFRDFGETDLPEDETSSTLAGNPWIELSATLTFASSEEVLSRSVLGLGLGL